MLLFLFLVLYVLQARAYFAKRPVYLRVPPPFRENPPSPPQEEQEQEQEEEKQHEHKRQPQQFDDRRIIMVWSPYLELLDFEMWQVLQRELQREEEERQQQHSLQEVSIV